MAILLADQPSPILEGIVLLGVGLAILLASVARSRATRAANRVVQLFWQEVSKAGYIWAAVTTVLLGGAVAEVEGLRMPVWLVLALLTGVVTLVAARVRWHRQGLEAAVRDRTMSPARTVHASSRRLGRWPSSARPRERSSPTPSAWHTRLVTPSTGSSPASVPDLGTPQRSSWRHPASRSVAAPRSEVSSAGASRSTPRLEVDGVTKLFHTTVALWQVAFAATGGSILLVQGPNGCGKSTLLRILAGLSTPTVGEVRWTRGAAASVRVAFLGHRSGLFDGLSPYEHLSLDGRLARTGVEAGLEMLARLDLTTVASRPCHGLSAGTRRRVALARLFATPSDVLLVDEPLSALDEPAATVAVSILRETAAAGSLVVVAAPADQRLRMVAHGTLSLSGGRQLTAVPATGEVLADAR